MLTGEGRRVRSRYHLLSGRRFVREGRRLRYENEFDKEMDLTETRTEGDGYRRTFSTDGIFRTKFTTLEESSKVHVNQKGRESDRRHRIITETVS